MTVHLIATYLPFSFAKVKCNIINMQIICLSFQIRWIVSSGSQKSSWLINVHDKHR